MKLRSKVVALSLLTLLLPWAGWNLLQELELYLREAEEDKLLGTARTLAAALPLDYQTRLIFAPDLYLPLRDLSREPALDGYADDWPDPRHGLAVPLDPAAATVDVLAGSHAGRLYLFFELREKVGERARAGAGSGGAQGIEIALRNPRGLFRVVIRPEAPGPLQLRLQGVSGGQVEGFWLDSEDGYRVELSLPVKAGETALNFRLPGAGGQALSSRQNMHAGSPERSEGWIRLLPRWAGLSGWFRQLGLENTRIWLVDAGAWVLSDSHPGGGAETEMTPGDRQTTWVQRVLYRLVAGGRTEIGAAWPLRPARLEETVVRRALKGEQGIHWLQLPDSAELLTTAAVPLRLEGNVRGALVVQSGSDGLLLVTNRALGRVLLATLGLALGLAAGLWYFATRLSRRVERLSAAVSRAMADRAEPETLPLTGDRDELGELARNNERLLQAVAAYGQYLQTLAGKLSHELKTPLAITRSSLDNLASRDLDPELRPYLERALEGLERQTAIVRAMSEASRLEAAIERAEWEEVDLAGLVRHCVDGYRAVHHERRIASEVPAQKQPLRCAPDLLAQALDKLVDNAISLSGPEDTVAIGLERADGEYRLTVRNSGSRLPDEFQERLFDSLVSLRDRRGKAPHLGLGLYIVRLVAAAHHGSVSAHNLPGGAGVEFRLILPVSAPL